VVDLGCGAGSITIFLEEQGAQITGIDLAPGLIALAREEAVKRRAKVDFIQASVLNYPLGEGIYDLAVCFGNPLTDFPHQCFPRFRDRVFDALKPGGHFILEYIDGLKRVASMSEPKEVIEQGVDSLIVRCFKGYDPATSAYTMEYRRVSTNEEFVQSIRLDHSFMDVYTKRCRD
jgi:SAM-dependent methyltransferase